MFGNYDQDAENSIPIRRFQPVRATLDPAPSDQDLIDIALDVALDCVSQAGVTSLRLLHAAAATT